MKQISVLMPEPYIEALDSLVDKERYPSRSAAIRAAIHRLLSSEVHLLKRRGQ